MITIAQIRSVRLKGADWDKAEALKNDLKVLRKRRSPFFLKPPEFERILQWKLGAQYARSAARRAPITSDLLRSVTMAAFTVQHEDRLLQLRVRAALLIALPGVGVPIASAILALSEPDSHGILDFRVWRQMTGRLPGALGVNAYATYMEWLWPIADKLGWPAQYVDWAVWHYDKVIYP